MQPRDKDTKEAGPTTKIPAQPKEEGRRDMPEPMSGEGIAKRVGAHVHIQAQGRVHQRVRILYLVF